MANKILFTSVLILCLSAGNAFAVDPEKAIDPEKEESTNKKTAETVRQEYQNHIRKGFYVKGEVLPFEKTEEKKTEEVAKTEKPAAEAKEDVQSFNFLYYILQSKVSDFISY